MFYNKVATSQVVATAVSRLSTSLCSGSLALLIYLNLIESTDKPRELLLIPDRF